MKPKMNLNKNDRFTVIFEDLTHEGLGIAKVNGIPVFVKDALVGEQAEIVIIKVKKNLAYGRVLTRLVESPERTEPKCDLFKQCGGCTVQHLSYEAQLKTKQKLLSDVLTRIGQLENVTVKPVLGMENPWSYRNKAQVPVGWVDGELNVGFYKQRTHEMIPMEVCYIQSKANDMILHEVKNLVKDFGITPYDEQKHTGVLRHILLREAKATGDVMVVLVTRTENCPSKQQLADAIAKKFPQVKSVVQNVNPRKTNVILGEQVIVLYGEKYIYDFIRDIQFAISAQSFYQVNPTQTKVLYEQALSYANLTGKEIVFDAYCGVGTISLFLAKRAKKVYGVEIVDAAIHDARRNAKLNQMDNLVFQTGKAEEVIPAWVKEGIRPDVIVVDPPRKGCDEVLLQTMLDVEPKRIVYVSCNPGTLARDLKFLTAGGRYAVQEVQPVDMFPMTGHVETVVLLSQLKQKPDDYINVTIELDDMDITSAETKATYDEIKRVQLWRH